MATTTTTPKPARRTLHFTTLPEALTEADRLTAAESAGRLTQLGSWTLGQSLHHCATWADFAFDGYPPSVRPPLPIRLILRLLKNKILHNPMRPGLRMRNLPAGTLATEPTPTPDALAHLHTSLTRLQSKSPTTPNPIFGPLTHQEWISLNLRHLELHLSFLIPT